MCVQVYRYTGIKILALSHICTLSCGSILSEYFQLYFTGIGGPGSPKAIYQNLIPDQ